MKYWSIFLLLVGCVWFLFGVWLLLTLSGIGGPASLTRLILYCGGMFAGPLILIAGSALLLRNASSTYGAVLVVTGCVIFTGFVLYNTQAGVRRAPLQAPPLYSFYITLLIIMVLADIAAYKLWRLLGSVPSAGG